MSFLTSYKKKLHKAFSFKITFLISFIVLFCLTSQSALAVKVAFFQELQPSGEVVSYDGNFAHVAISYNGKWLHADFNSRKITLTENLNEIGNDFIIIENDKVKSPGIDFYNKEKNKKFNIFASWNSTVETYCSKLVADFFNIPPTLMKFDSPAWEELSPFIPEIEKAKNTYGISPNEVYSHLAKNLGFTLIFSATSKTSKLNQRSCRNVL